MIQNDSINKKLNEKTKDDPVLHDFIEKLLDNEVEGKNYKKFYNSEISHALRINKED